MILRSSQRLTQRWIRSAHLLKSFDFLRSRSMYTRWQPLESLTQPSLIDFQEKAFRPLKPYHLVSSCKLPASIKWVNKTVPASLNAAYFYLFQDKLYLPMELTTEDGSFTRTEAPLSIFLDYLRQMDSEISRQSSMPHMYIAQAPLHLLPPELLRDVPTPEFVLKAGNGDVYDSSLWAGPSDAARTPLHCDPNPNILVQVAGTKVVRLLPPEAGTQIYRSIRSSSTEVNTGGTMATMRGEEMMGQEGKQIDKVIWEGLGTPMDAREAILRPGDGIFIPNGWWHSIRSIGNDFNISVNWWFR